MVDVVVFFFVVCVVVGVVVGECDDGCDDGDEVDVVVGYFLVVFVD